MKDRLSSSPRVGRDLGRSSHPGLTKAPLSDECSARGSFNACLCVLVDVDCVVVLRKCFMKYSEVSGRAPMSDKASFGSFSFDSYFANDE